MEGEEHEESMPPSMEHREDDVEEEPPRVVSVVDTSTRTSSCVWNLPPQFTQSDLIAYFKQFGLIAEATVEDHLARTDQRRHAFVRYYNLESGRAAVANMDGHVMGGCRLAAMHKDVAAADVNFSTMETVCHLLRLLASFP
ncbi:ribonucleoprotein [Echinococcus granulosus]|uniref:Ribonucleoprotein n=1 Tax=Echinococcus granulosus TaxID=6210 RepID=W6UMU4_ECHGR|nr:ribonucleoprotein [Echinococcus granulosus]EUB54814.1 ribonucleoprotein [Echinococcus granulosus]